MVLTRQVLCQTRDYPKSEISFNFIQFKAVERNLLTVASAGSKFKIALVTFHPKSSNQNVPEKLSPILRKIGFNLEFSFSNFFTAPNVLAIPPMQRSPELLLQVFESQVACSKLK